jgi:hypothetical protein
MLYAFETSLAVADFGDDFDLCSEALDDASAEAAEYLQAVLGHVPTILDVEFIEFDSNNPSHANAYFAVTIDCSELDVQLIEEDNP